MLQSMFHSEISATAAAARYRQRDPLHAHLLVFTPQQSLASSLAPRARSQPPSLALCARSQQQQHPFLPQRCRAMARLSRKVPAADTHRRARLRVTQRTRKATRRVPEAHLAERVMSGRAPVRGIRILLGRAAQVGHGLSRNGASGPPGRARRTARGKVAVTAQERARGPSGHRPSSSQDTWKPKRNARNGRSG